MFVSTGGFGNQRFGSESAFEQVRPVLSLTVRGRRSSFVLGTLPPLSSDLPAGPDRNGPHELLPPLQRETLAFDRPYENGLAWTFNGSDLQHHFWLEWQRLNRPAHRERFDGGLRTSYRLSNVVTLPLQLHVARTAVLDVSGRLHRVEGRYEYSFRILSVASVFWKLR